MEAYLERTSSVVLYIAENRDAAIYAVCHAAAGPTSSAIRLRFLGGAARFGGSCDIWPCRGSCNDRFPLDSNESASPKKSANDRALREVSRAAFAIVSTSN